ncbi:MAG: hypothetical protein QGG40_01040 [Myxococcota bacterium]|nr:hypothetical protein [Myxococcota bacterium]
MTAWMIIGGALAVWVLLELKTSRPDGTLVRTHPYRRLMWYIMPTRIESMAYIDVDVDATQLESYLARARERFGANITHTLVAGVHLGLRAAPTSNRFVVGKRLYERKGYWVTFSMKRKKLDRKAKLATVKLEMLENETFRELCERINGEIGTQRSGKKTGTDLEFQLFNALPRPALELMTRVLRLLDYYNLLPSFFIRGDGLYTSAFVVNLGSLGMPAAYHHLFEYGTAMGFLAAGTIVDDVRFRDGKVEPWRRLPMRVAFDERIEDGLSVSRGLVHLAKVLEDPYRYLGCLEDDGSDASPLWPQPNWLAEDDEG